MAWVKKTANGMGFASETFTLPGSATTVYSSVIDFIKPFLKNANYRIAMQCEASAVSGTNVDIGLYGADVAAGTNKFLLLDAPVADVTNAAKVASGIVDLNAYPAPFYFISYTTDVSEAANTMTTRLWYQKVNY